MALSTVITTGGGGGVSWQADIPGLASLGLTLGRSGLKKFAQAGVDFHTILCFSDIAEKCPASVEYRKEISDCRQAQRKETQWVYKVVELGAGTNFVADELLKKRAGENVVALLSAVISVMSEKTCDRLLLKLFEAAGSDLDSTPGFAQLRAFRESMTPLAKRTNFKDRVFQYHILSRNLLGQDIDGSESRAYEHIPDEETAVKVILALSKLTQENSEFVLDYYGLSGSGWVIAYARHVLGLPVCIVSSPSKAIPISGDYQSARVLVHIYCAERECKLLAHGNVQDYFVTRPAEPSGRNGWQIDVDSTNLLDSCIPQSDPIRKVCNIIARSLSHYYTERLAAEFGHTTIDSDSNSIRLIKYSEYCLPKVHQKAQSILTSFGFEINKGSKIEQGTWESYLDFHPPFHRLASKLPRFLDPCFLLPNSGWDEKQLGHISRSKNYSGKEFDKSGSTYLNYLFRLVTAASWLAFTDWDQNVRLLSLNFLDSDNGNPRDHDTIGNRSSLWIENWNANDLCKIAVEIILGRDERRQELIFPLSIAFHQQGIVFSDKMVLQHTLNLESQILHVVRGTIQAHGEEKTSIFAQSDAHYSKKVRSSEINMIPPFGPTDMFPHISIQERVETDGRQICIVNPQVVINNEILFLSAETYKSASLGRIYVTEPCVHGYTDVFLDTSGYDSRLLQNVTQGLCLGQSQGRLVKGFRMMDGPTISLQAVDQNPTGQWLASWASDDENGLTILQRNCCIRCALEVTHQVADMTSLIRIVHGRMKGEELKF